MGAGGAARQQSGDGAEQLGPAGPGCPGSRSAARSLVALTPRSHCQRQQPQPVGGRPPRLTTPVSPSSHWGSSHGRLPSG